MTTATKPRPAAAVAVSPADLFAVKEYLDPNVLIERSLELRVAILALLAGVNIHLLGPPGVAKSLTLRELCACVLGAQYFEKPLNAGMPADAIMGAYDMGHFSRTGEFQRNTTGMLPEADVSLIDEIFRANGPTQDALLPIANVGERQYEHNGGMHKSGLLLFGSASNHMPDDDNEQAQALVDRVTLVLHVERLKARDSFKQLMRGHKERRIAKLEGTWERDRVTVTVEQVREAQRQVTYIDNTRDEFLDALAELRDNVYAEGIGISDRRWGELGQVMDANAWLAGRDHTTSEDCAVAEYGLSTDPEHKALAHELVLGFLGSFEKLAVEKAKEAAKPLAEWAELRPVVATAGVRLDRELLSRGVDLTRDIDDVKARVDKDIAQAEVEKRDCTSLREIAAELLGCQTWLHANKFPTNYSPAP